MATSHSGLVRERSSTKRGTRFGRAKLNYWTDVGAFVFGLVVFVTGLVLLIEFHVGESVLRASAFGVSRLVWVNIHRLTAVLVLGAVVIHAALHWRAIVVRVNRACRNLPGRAGPADLTLYFGFLIEMLAGFVAWLALPGSPPLFGPVDPNHLQPVRHICIDVHNVTGLILLPAAVIHVRRHSGWMLDAARVGKKPTAKMLPSRPQ